MRPRRTLHERLSDQRALLGLLHTHPQPALAEMAGFCGFDFVLLDGEHGVFSEMDYLHALRALAATDVLALVRLAGHDPRALGRYLDMGADGIVVPSISTVEQAQTFARAMEYPPAGTRGVGASLHRATRYGLDGAAYMQAPRARAALIVLIESALGVANAAGILAVDGVDGAIIGPSDLSADLGETGNFSRPEFVQAVTRIEQAARGAGKVLGTAPHGGQPIEAFVARGHRLLITTSDISLMREAMRSHLANARAALEAQAPPEKAAGGRGTS